MLTLCLVMGSSCRGTEKSAEECFVIKKTAQKKKRSRGQLKEASLQALEDIAHTMTQVLRTVARNTEKKVSWVALYQELDALYSILRTGNIKNSISKEKNITLQSVLLKIADIQEALLLRVREGLEDDGAGVFTRLPYAEFTALVEYLELKAPELRRSGNMLD